MNIVFRVDSSTQIGSGHLMRCLTLAGQLNKRYLEATVIFISRELEGNLNQLVETKGYKLLQLPRMAVNDTLSGYEQWITVKQETDGKQTVHELEKLDDVSMLVVDSYAIDEVWENIVRPCVQQIMVIDDLANRKHNCDVLLDQNYYLDMNERYQGLVPQDCQLLLGPQHALFRDEFYETKKHLRKRDGIIKNIFVFFGGSDLTNETMKALQAIEMLGRLDIEVNVVVGASNQHKRDIESFCSDKPNMYYYCQVSNIAELMNEADLAIGAGGTTTWERCFLELPSIVIAIADNQVKLAEDCGKANVIKYLGLAQDIDTNMILSCLKQLMQQDNMVTFLADIRNSNIVG